MTERPIIMTGESVRGILAGSKTQTRRVVDDANSVGNFRASELLLSDPRTFVDLGPSPAGNPGPYLHVPVNAFRIESNRDWNAGDCDPSIVERLYPRYQPGDRLWVRETCLRMLDSEHEVMYSDHEDYDICHPTKGQTIDLGWRACSAIHMPRWASRIALEITEVRVERVADISEDDARAEGSFLGRCDCAVMRQPAQTPIDAAFRQTGCHIHGTEFRAQWDTINAKRKGGAFAWSKNPWVWAISFRLISEQER